jgi:hypothetical protein
LIFAPYGIVRLLGECGRPALGGGQKDGSGGGLGASAGGLSFEKGVAQSIRKREPPFLPWIRSEVGAGLPEKWREIEDETDGRRLPMDFDLVFSPGLRRMKGLFGCPHQILGPRHLSIVGGHP